jgi:hypothetical protein
LLRRKDRKDDKHPQLDVIVQVLRNSKLPVAMKELSATNTLRSCSTRIISHHDSVSKKPSRVPFDTFAPAFPSETDRIQVPSLPGSSDVSSST